MDEGRELNATPAEPHSPQQPVSDDEGVVEGAGDMECDQHHEQSRKTVVSVANGKRPEIRRQGALMPVHDLWQSGLQRHDQAASDLPENRDVKQPMRDPGQTIEPWIAS